MLLATDTSKKIVSAQYAQGFFRKDLTGLSDKEIYAALKERQAKAHQSLEEKREEARKALKAHDAKGPGKPGKG